MVSIRPRRRASMDRPRHGARAPLLAVMVDDVGEHGLVGLVHEIRRAGAGRQPMRMSRGPSLRNEKPRSGASSCIDETPISRTTRSTCGAPASARRVSSSPKRPGSEAQAPFGLRDQPAAPPRSPGIAVDRHHLQGRVRAPAAPACSRRRRRCRRPRGRLRSSSAATTSSSRTGTCGWAERLGRRPVPGRDLGRCATPDHRRLAALGAIGGGRLSARRRKPGRGCGSCVSWCPGPDRASAARVTGTAPDAQRAKRRARTGPALRQGAPGDPIHAVDGRMPGIMGLGGSSTHEPWRCRADRSEPGKVNRRFLPRAKSGAPRAPRALTRRRA